MSFLGGVIVANHALADVATTLHVPGAAAVGVEDVVTAVSDSKVQCTPVCVSRILSDGEEEAPKVNDWGRWTTG